MRNDKLIAMGIFLIGIFSIGLVLAQFTNSNQPYFSGSTGSTNSYQYTSPSFNSYYSSSDLSTYWPILQNIQDGQCTATSDFLVMIRPGSCTPSVVRSDLLEEQNVPVFCQLDAVRINPLIQVSSIKSISFKGQYPEGVVGISFHPARAAVRSYNTLLGSPLLNNIGYVVIILKRNAVEDKMPEWVSGNLTATIYYDAEHAYGTGKAEFYLPEMSDDDWNNNYKASSFWNGRGFLRVESVDDKQAVIGLYTDQNHKYRTVTLEKGKQSDLIYFPGFYCMAGLRLKLNDFSVPEDQALLNIDGDEIWVRQGSKILNDRCSVTKLNALSDGGSIEISCSGQKIVLGLTSALKANISIGGIENSVNYGGLVFNGKQNQNTKLSNWYYAYSGVVPNNVMDSNIKGKNFAVLVSSDKEISSDEISVISSAIEKLKDAGQIQTKIDFERRINQIRSAIVIYQGENTDVYVGDTKTGIVYNKIFKDEVKDSVNTLITEEYFNKSQQAVSDLINLYPQEKGELDRFGETELWEQINLASTLGKQNEKALLLKRFTETYPDSKFIQKAIDDLNLLGNYDYSSAYKSIYVNNEYKSISVKQFKPTGKGEKTVLMNIAGQVGTFSEGDKISFGNDISKLSESDSYLVVEKINADNILLRPYNYSNDRKAGITFVAGGSFTMKQDETKLALGKTFSIKKINVEKVAYVSVIPEIRDTDTEANFTFKIGIEKRAIKLSPEKTKEMMSNLNKSIADWEDINEKLGNLITGWKGACFATSSILMLKNLGAGFSGETIARQKIMQAYKDKCDTEFEGMSHTQCYNQFSSQIDKDVAAYTKAIGDVNAQIKTIQEPYTKSDGLLGTDKYVDGEAALNDFKNKSSGTIKLTLPGENKTVDLDVKNLRSWEDYKAYMLEQNLQSAGISSDALKTVENDANSQLYAAYRAQEEQKKLDTAKKDSSVFGGTPNEIKYLGKTGAVQTLWGGDTVNKFPELIAQINEYRPGSELNGNEKIQFVNDGTANYVLVLNNNDITKGTGVQDKGLYKIDGNNVAPVIDKNTLTQFQKYSFISGGSCSNTFVNPKVKYYEVEPNIQLPAIVPFDLKKGWYAKVSQSVGGVFSSQQKGYQSSGAVSFFYICNVGGNGKEENMGGDDICQSFDINTYNSVSTFGGCNGLSASEVRKLVQDAQQAIRQAEEQYGKKTVNILGQAIQTGEPLNGAGELFECQDFMSPDDCKVLFNVCDPVICPSSRCNLGGKYPVSDVVQTGIIGSIMLCLPNIKDGVMVPVCLTGIHAGLESYISILKSEYQCLDTSLQTGQHVGICDAVTSIYLCEFFWRQLSPLLNIIIPKMVEMAYGQNVRGGGEYLTVMHSWDTLQKSVSYFKDNYAQNAFRAFEYKSVEDAGTEVCKAFVGSSFPSSASALEKLLEPESPYQFYAQFDEIPFTDATVPATSHYKIYYHIFSGNDIGQQFVIYLTEPPASSYYSTQSRIVVKTGYVAVGTEADETLDFTAPAGYKKLCVVINSKEECGFGKVTTDFAINYLSDKYIADQANQTGITSEKTCISGTPSVLSMVNVNVQAGAEEVLNPQVDLNGVVRVCSTNNPGLQVGNDSRWKEVGNCGNSNIKCWLDTQSVKEEVARVNAVEGSLTDVASYISGIDSESNTLNENDSLDILNVIRQKIPGLKNKLTSRMSSYDVSETIKQDISQLDEIENKGYLNAYRAEAIALKAEIYRFVAGFFSVASVDKAKPVVASSTSTIAPISDIGFLLDYDNKILYNGVETGYSLISNGDGYDINNANSDMIGHIDKNGEITLVVSFDGEEESMANLEKYKFVGGEFVLKSGSTGSSGTISSGTSSGCSVPICSVSVTETAKGVTCIFLSFKDECDSEELKKSITNNFEGKGFPKEITITLSNKFTESPALLLNVMDKNRASINGDVPITDFQKRDSDGRWVKTYSLDTPLNWVEGTWTFRLKCPTCEVKEDLVASYSLKLSN